MIEISFTPEVWLDLIANDDEATTQPGTQVVIPILANDTLNNESVTLGDLAGLPTITQQPEVGTATINENGELVYAAPKGFSGTVTLEYMIETLQCSEASFGDNLYSNLIEVFPSWIDDSQASVHNIYFSNSEDPASEGDGVWYINVQVETYEWGGFDISRINTFGDVPYSHYEDPPNVVSGFVVEYGDTTQVQCAEISLQANTPT